jgi:hypothetical protein
MAVRSQATAKPQPTGPGRRWFATAQPAESALALLDVKAFDPLLELAGEL